MDAVSESRLQNVYPELAARVRRMAEILESEGIEVRVVQAVRTVPEQDELYAQGRTMPGKIVTNVRGGHSYHNFGLAVDLVPSQFAPDKPFSPDWNSSHPAWRRLVKAGIALGLDSGATWRTFKDFPHFQLTGRFPEGAPNDEVRRLAVAGGNDAVWAAVSASLR